MAKKSTAPQGVPTRPIDMPYKEPDNTRITVKKADNGGHVINHYGSQDGKSFDKTVIAHSKEHAKKLVSGMIP